MRGLIFFLSFLLIFTISSCHKNKTPESGPSSIKNGHVIDAHTGKGVFFAGVWVAKKDPNITGAWAYSTAAYALADSNGYFDMDFDYDGNYTYYLRAQKDPWYAQTDYQQISAGTNNGTVIKMAAYGWIKFNVINEPPLDTIYEFNASAGAPLRMIVALFRDTTLYDITLGNQNADIVYSYIKSNKEVKVKDNNKYVSSSDTLNYVIKY